MISHRILLVGGARDLAERLRRVAPRAELLLAADAAAGEPYLGQVDAVIASARVTPAYARAQNLRWLHLTAAGIEAQAIPELRDAPFSITHKALASVNPMADHVMAQILVHSRRVLEVYALQRERRWAEHGGAAEEAGDLRGKTLGVVGLGAVVQAIARRARPCRIRVSGTKRDACRHPTSVARANAPSSLGEVLAEADYVALKVPLTAVIEGLSG